MQKGSFFKVLDLFQQRGKIQIMLLHFPEENWELFKHIKISIDEEVIEYARKRFEECLDTDPVPELAKENWLERCSFPLDMDDEGNLFSLVDNK